MAQIGGTTDGTRAARRASANRAPSRSMLRATSTSETLPSAISARSRLPLSSARWLAYQITATATQRAWAPREVSVNREVWVVAAGTVYFSQFGQDTVNK